MRTLPLSSSASTSAWRGFTEGKLDAIPVAAEVLVKARVDLIFTSQEAATQAAKDATESIPIVFTLVGDPVGAGIVASIARPGGNVTGICVRRARDEPALAPRTVALRERLCRVRSEQFFALRRTTSTGS